MRERLLVAVICPGLLVAGCSTATDPRAETTVTATTTTVPGKPAAPAPVRQECVDVADKANEFLSQVVRLADGDSSTQRVRAAADGLSDSLGEARAAVGADAAADLDDAGRALGRARAVLAARPVDTAGLRTAANDLLTSLGDAAAVCTPDAVATSTEESKGAGTGIPPAPSTNVDHGTPTLDPTY